MAKKVIDTNDAYSTNVRGAMSDINDNFTELYDQGTTNVAVLDEANAFTSTGVNSFAGDVGIGTNTPIGGLHVANDGDGIWVSDINEGVTSSDSSYFKQSGDTAYLVNKNSGSLRLGTNNFNNMFTIDSTGKVGIGTTTPNEELEISAVAPTIRFTDSNDVTFSPSYGYIQYNVGGFILAGADTVRMYTNGFEKMRIDVNGNMGVGENNPSAKLDVDGSFKASGSTTFGAEVTMTPQTATGDGTTTIDWSLGNFFHLQMGGQAETVTFTNPSEAGIFKLKVTQPSDGAAAGLMNANLPTTIKWLNGDKLNYTRGDSTVDMVDLYFDGTDWYGEAKKNFTVHVPA
tara:strand:+ start:679 stop:1710 length:1032 start_codon:yes stop_codon:yes gene_type:complete